LPFPGVVVSIVSDALLGGNNMATVGVGRFVFIELPPGTYTVTAKSDGFATVQRQNVPVNVGRTQMVTMEMPADAEGEEMVIEDRNPVIDTESANRGSVLTREFLDRIPAGRSYQSAVQLTAGVSGGSNPNVGGASSNENTYMLDGVNITDPVTGTFSLNFNFDSIEQLEVITDAFDPEYGVNLGGVVNIVTQTGSNNFEFRSGVYHKNGSWSPKQDWRFAADGTTLSPSDFGSKFETWIVGGQISGPIIKDKAWFIASYQMTRSLIAVRCSGPA
jgi:outer membrane receptor protein involved in Fe transport